MDTNVIVSLKGRPSAKVQKHFKDLDMDWSFAEQKMRRWAGQTRSHQNPKIELVINLKAKEPPTTSNTTRKEGERCCHDTDARSA